MNFFDFGMITYFIFALLCTKEAIEEGGLLPVFFSLFLFTYEAIEDDGLLFCFFIFLPLIYFYLSSHGQQIFLTVIYDMVSSSP